MFLDLNAFSLYMAKLVRLNGCYIDGSIGLHGLSMKFC
uniref:Uncharacterized protein n=1 Tax=Arundo donax TaxID=35708 RepID=A0A0A9FWW8_ARUDO